MKSQEVITDFGGHGSVVVLLHGFVSSSAYWKRLQPHLTAAGYRVIMIDLLGFGKATHLPAKTYDYDEHIQHIHDSIQSLHLDKPYTLVGHSMGALLAARYGVTHPAHIERLFLLHPPIYQTRDEAQQTIRSTGRHYRFLLNSRFRGMGWGVLRAVPGGSIANHTRASRENSLVNVIEATELVDDLQRLSIPTVLLVGQRDRPQYVENIARVSLPENILVQIEDVAHHAPTSHPELVVEMIIRYS